MAAATGNKFTDTFNSANPNSARVTSTRTAGAASLSSDNLAGWPTVSKVHFATYKIDTNSAKVAGSQIDWYGIVSGNTIGSMTRLAGATDAGNAIGDVVEMMPTGSWAHDLYSGLTQEHNQDGTHGVITATSLAATGAITAASFNTTAVNGINQAALPLGAVVQVVSSTSAAVATGTTLIPRDDTIPQNTEGDQYMTLAITPKVTTNTLIIQGSFFLSSSVGQNMIVALFQDSNVNALAVAELSIPTGTGIGMVPIVFSVAAGTTSATTFKIRAGGSVAGTTTFNGSAAGRLYGAISKSALTITEVKS